MKNKNIKELENRNTRDLETTTAAILRAALELGEELGFEGLTVEGIAARSGIAKTTIYRRWPNVGAIVMDAFLADVTRLAPIQVRSTARESFTASMRLLARAYRGRLGKILRPLLGRAQADENLREAGGNCSEICCGFTGVESGFRVGWSSLFWGSRGRWW